MSIQRQNISSCINLRNIYRNRKGVKQNFFKEKTNYELAINYNDFAGYSSLGYIYKHGLGVPIDYLKAKKYFQYGKFISLIFLFR